MWTIEERRAYKRQWNKKNKGKYRKQELLWRAQNYERINEARFTRNLKKLYNITRDEYEAMFVDQKGCCAICKQPQLNKRLGVDHNHQTKKIRGLLCDSCNGGIGLFRERPELLRLAIKYLKEYA